MIVGPNCSNGLFQAMGGAGDIINMVAACKVYTSASRTNMVFMSCNFAGAGTGLSWDYPTNAYTMTQLNCNESKAWTYSQLPTGSNALEGDLFTITDGAKSGGGTAGWGDAVQGSAAQRLLVRWNGSAYTVVGK